MQNKKNAKSSPSKKGNSKTSSSNKSMKKAAPARSGRTTSKNTKSKPSNKSTTNHKPNSQAQQVLNHLVSKGSINTIEAIDKYKVYRLGAVIYNLKKNHDIETSTHEVKGKNGVVSKVAKYTLG